MLGAVLSFAAMAIAVRELQRHMGTLQILALRTGMTLVIVTVLVTAQGRAVIATQRFTLHATRALVHLLGQYCWMYAIGALALATVFAIEFTMPVWTALLAAAFLGERLTQGRVVQLVLGLVGVAIILRPGLGQFHPAALVMLLGSLFYAGNMIFTKRLSATDTALAVTFWMSAVQLPVTLVAALPSWVAPPLADPTHGGQPAGEVLVGVAGGAQAQVAPVGRGDGRRGALVVVGHAEGGVPRAQQRVDLVGEPRGVPELEGGADVGRQQDQHAGYERPRAARAGV